VARSLYWRIAFGFIGFLALIVAAQAAVFVWLLSRSFGAIPGREFAAGVANEVGAALDRDPSLDLQRFVTDEYRQAHPFFLVMSDGRVIGNTSTPPPEPLVRMARARLERRDRAESGAPDVGRRGAGPEGSARGGGPRFGRGRPGYEGALPGEFRRGRGAPFDMPFIEAAGVVRGVVALAPIEPLRYVLRRYAPTLAVIAVGFVCLGTALAAVVVFRPTRRRIHALQTATARLGAGDLDARAPEEGSDEIAALARSFNQMAHDLSQRDEQVRTADRLRRQLLADVSHELNTPITAIRGYVETLAMPGLAVDEATRARYMQVIEDETRRLERLVVDLLDLARFEGGGGALAPREIRTDDLFRRIAARHERAVEEKNVALRITVASDAATFTADPDRLEQVLQNLAANAVRHTPPGGTIDVSAARDGASVVLTVTDSGEGIPPEHLPHIFDRFYKVDEARAQRSGSGLGLSIAKAIVERHGGTISAASAPGHTVFTIRLPDRTAPI
jgi:signal transduction histidine kinase